MKNILYNKNKKAFPMIKREEYQRYKKQAFINPFLPIRLKAIVLENYNSNNPSIKHYKKIEEAIKILKEFEKENLYQYLLIPYEVRKLLGFTPPEKITSSYEDLKKLKRIRDIYYDIYYKKRGKKVQKLIKKANKKAKKAAAYLELSNFLFSWEESSINTIFAIIGILGLIIGITLQVYFLEALKIDKVTSLAILGITILVLITVYILITIYSLTKPIRLYNKEKYKYIKDLEKINKEFYTKLKKEFPEIYKQLQKD